MNIGTAEKLSGLSCKTIRDYEAAGLIRPLRQSNGYRSYSEADIATLCFIKHAREVDFSLAQIAELLALRNNPQRVSADVKALVGEHIQRLNQKITDLNSMKDTLENWYKHCGGNASPQCAIIDGLNKHGCANSRD
ncbi:MULTISPECIES: MerR family DNA-binding protein [Snodgrassella]|uniref:MerR family DNA-binding protein n=1 Tax=Snodgrassella TaxID=1193515 RepID=UPI001EF45016|nr:MULTISPECIES: MerR family DNA-binding protein [Snodgrassella]MCO6506825.1 MerR family DNA-binding protein [Snodgrassella sp.]MCO6518191.1 MerR family DNA-binding protein [Snodgrassella sp.]